VGFGYYFLKRRLDISMRDVWELGWQESKRLLAKAKKEKKEPVEV